MAVISPGRAPVTRYEKETMLQTANELFLYQEDITSIDKKSIPIVIGYNNVKQHYVPTGVISPRMYTEFKLSCVAKLVDACLSLASPVDTNFVPVNLLPAYANLKTSMVQFRSSFEETQFTEHTAALTAAGSATSSDAQSIPSSSGVEGPLHDLPQAPGISKPSPSRPTKEKRKMFSKKDRSGKFGGVATWRDDKGRKVCVCDQCGVKKIKKNDYGSHMETAHGGVSLSSL